MNEYKIYWNELTMYLEFFAIINTLLSKLSHIYYMRAYIVDIESESALTTYLQYNIINVVTIHNLMTITLGINLFRFTYRYYGN